MNRTPAPASFIEVGVEPSVLSTASGYVLLAAILIAVYLSSKD